MQTVSLSLDCNERRGKASLALDLGGGSGWGNEQSVAKRRLAKKGKTVKTATYRKKQTRLTILAVLFTLISTLAGSRAIADDALEAAQLIEKARLTFESFMTVEEMQGFRDLMKSARGVFIMPQVLKGAFILGASGGSGVFLAYDSQTGRWSDPAFYTMGEVSLGLQIGG